VLAQDACYEEALADTERVLKLDPDSAKAHTLRTRCLERLNRLD